MPAVASRMCDFTGRHPGSSGTTVLPCRNLHQFKECSVAFLMLPFMQIDDRPRLIQFYRHLRTLSQRLGLGLL